MKRNIFTLSAAALVLVMGTGLSLAADEFETTIKEHRFNPDRIIVPAGKRITLWVKNDDSTPEEFESHDLKIEKIIKGNSKGKIVFGPLKPGEYKFVGEFHEKFAKGVIVAK
ncbi:MAG: cupredoxin domain-containing protein [Proteobacteria bacterium]|nr:cupredoxin domain-containing protein [Pseudomonadota bacterium]